MDIISDISLVKDLGKVRLLPSYSVATSETPVQITKVIIEKYEVEPTLEFLKEIRKSVDLQQVMQHSGANTALSSKVFWTGGANIYKEPYLIDISHGVERNYEFFVDEASNISDKIYLYRVISYGTNNYEFATRYVAGIIDDTSFFDSKNPYINYLDKEDVMELLPEGNIEGLRIWVKYMALFQENFNLRFYGEIEDFKFNVKLSRAFLNTYFMTELMRRIEQRLLLTEVNLYALST